MNSRRKRKQLQFIESLESRALLSAVSPHATPPKVAHVVITQQPELNVRAGSIALMKVTLEDTSGHTITTANDNVSIRIASGPSGGNLFGTLTVKAVKGIATFNAFSFGKIGGYKLKAVDGKISSANSQVVNVTLGAAAKLKLVSTFPTNAQSVPTGAIGPIVVDVTDWGGNLVNRAGAQQFSIVAANGRSAGWIQSGTFVLNEKVTQAASGATGIVVGVGSGTGSTVTINILSGTFNSANVITGVTSHATLTPTGNPILATVPSFTVTATLSTTLNTASVPGTVSQVANGTANTTNGVATITLASANSTTTSNTTNGPSPLGLAPGYYTLTVTATSAAANGTTSSSTTLVSQTIQVFIR